MEHSYIDILREQGTLEIQSSVWNKKEQAVAFSDLEKDLKTIEEYTVSYPKIKYFLDELLTAKNADDDGLYFDAISELVRECSGASTLSAGDLQSFMINYFYDDAYFSLVLKDNVYVVDRSLQSGHSQDPKTLVMAAKHNANQRWEMDNDFRSMAI